MKHALTQFDVLKQSAADKRLAFFFDYDGTLTPIVDKPEWAVLSETMHHCLLQLSDQYAVSVISGRELADVRKQVGIDSIYYAGNHGLQLSGPGQEQSTLGTEFLALIKSVYQTLTQALSGIQGLLIENKKLSLSVHYRLVAPELVSTIEKAVDSSIVEHPNLAKHLGKKVFEIRPKIDWHKGKALFHVFQALGFSLEDVMPIYVGDDVTDEDAFDVLKNKGIGILVANEPRPSAATFYVASPDEVMQLLTRFIQ